MNIIILHRNEAFANYLKKYLFKEGFDHIDIAGILDLSNGFDRFKINGDFTSKLILDAHITGNMSACEGFDWVNKLRLKFNFLHPIILLSWFSWDEDYKQKELLRKHLEWYFLYDYEKRQLKDLKILKLPVPLNELLTELQTF